MWLRLILFISLSAIVAGVCCYLVKHVFSIKSINDFDIGSLAGWLLGCIFMIIYINYGSEWIKKQKKAVQSFGIPFPKGFKVGDVLTISPNTVSGKTLSPEKYYKWTGKDWIEISPSDGGLIYTFYYKNIQP